MASIIFYSWQSDLPNATNRGFIQEALERAAQAVRADDSIEVEPVIDRDTAGVPGSPDIAATILEKIDQCDVFVCDVSIINSGGGGRPTPNPNVLIELGYALKRLGWKRIVMVFNSAFASVEDLPFDLRMKRVLRYKVHEEDQQKAPERGNLRARLTTALQEIYRHSLDWQVNIPVQGPEPTPEDYTWHDIVRSRAMEGYSQSGLSGYVEAFATLSPPRVNCSQSQLLQAANASMIRTFGWPIGIMDLNANHMRPKAMSDGISNAVVREGKSYDFWSLRRDGVFYLLQTFFEDSRCEGHLFFDTRIVRTAEMLLYLSRLYHNLKIPGDSRLLFTLRHSGLKGRFLLAASDRILFRPPQAPATTNEIETSVVTPIFSIEDSLAHLVKELLTPVFMLFDFFEISQDRYDEIVNAFQDGRII
jgi:hypothetical protein